MSNNATGYPSIDKPWEKYYKHETKGIQIPKMSLFQYLEKCCSDWHEKPALEMRVSSNGYRPGFVMPYGRYLSEIKKCAHALKALETHEDEIVVTILPNIPESRILIYGINILGATVYPVSPMAPPEMLKSIIAENNVKTVFVFEGLYGKYEEAFEGDSLLHVICLTGAESLPPMMRGGAQVRSKRKPSSAFQLISFDAFMRAGAKDASELEPFYREGHTAAIIGTSGTTGTSKGVCLTDENLNSLALEQRLAEVFLPGEVSLDALISSIGYGISMEHSAGCCGVHSILIPELITDVFPKLLCDIKPDNFAGGPVHYINLERSDEYKARRVPKVRNLISGGATLDKELECRINGTKEGYSEQRGANIVVRQGYGATECCGSATYQIEGAYKFGGIGVPLPLENMGIFKPGTDIELPYGEEGEICISSPTVMAGYLNNLEETANVLKEHSDGKIWLHLADLGWCDEDGQFYITDRIKNIFMRTGFNVHPAKVAEFIASQNGVAECCVIGVEHPDEQMVPVAFVVLDSSADDVQCCESRLAKACADNLSETDIPYEWVFVDALPRNMGGKVDTAALLEESGVQFGRCIR